MPVPYFSIKRWGSLAFLLLGLFAAGAAWGPRHTTRAAPDPEASSTPTLIAFSTPEEAFQSALAEYIARIAPSRSFKLGEMRQEGEWAYVLAQEVDAAGRPASEWMVALLGHRESGGWYALAPSVAAAKEYNALLDRFPDHLLDIGDKAYFRQPEGAVVALARVTGHRLPWPAGQIGYVTQKDVPPYHMNQVDFDILGSATSGDVYASKPGRVVFVKEDSNTGGPGADYKTTNLVVIEHGPAEFSWYLHLAYNSVPVSVGDWVSWGSKIGVEGATGNATGVHLHYMVSTSHTPWSLPGDPDYLPWPVRSEDIVAVDFAEARWDELIDYWTCHCSYRSTNSSSLEVIPPDGGIISPSPDTKVVTGTIHLEGWAADSQSGLDHAHFTAFYQGAWHQVGPDFITSPFSFDWDPCQDGLLDGYVMLGLDIWDKVGNLAHSPQGDREVWWSGNCLNPTPSATPTMVAVPVEAPTPLSVRGYLPLICSGSDGEAGEPGA